MAAKVPRDLSDLLLQDVLVEVHEKTSRIEDAISTVQGFVQRLRSNLEPEVSLTANFVQMWDAKYASFKAWKSAKRSEVYLENWIQCDELRSAPNSESFRNLEKALRGGILTMPKRSSSFNFGGKRVPRSTPLARLPSLDHVSRTTSGSWLLGHPDRRGQLSLIMSYTAGTDRSPTMATAKQELPLWLQAAADIGGELHPGIRRSQADSNSPYRRSSPL
jgi:hypothetical protein